MAKWHPMMYVSPEIPQENPILNFLKEISPCCTTVGETKETNDVVDSNNTNNSSA